VIWFLIKLPGEIRVVKDDIVEKYLLIVNSYDGSYAVHVIETPIRVVCQNTMNAALNNAKAGFYQKHYQSMNFDVAQIRGQLGWVNDKFNVLEQAYQKMAKVQIDDATKKKYFEFVLNWPVKQEDVTAQFRNKMETLDYLFTEGRGQDNPEVKGSVWAGYNAVTEFVDYGFRKDTASRARSALMGAGSLIKSRAIDFALELIK
jgi:phage/plasmid-like protein (TIGR03299 family)